MVESSQSRASQLAAIDHIVVLMLENRSFDHLLGFLYTESGNVSPSGQDFKGLRGDENNPGPDGQPVSVFRIEPSMPGAYLMPGADPGEGFVATNQQLFGTVVPPSSPVAPTNSGFVTNFAQKLESATAAGSPMVRGTAPHHIMGVFTPASLPILSTLARSYAVCDHWFASVPSQTMPNRAFAAAATSQGHMDDETKTFTCPSIFGLATTHGVTWRIYGYDQEPLTRLDFPDITDSDDAHFGLFNDFQAAAAEGTLAAYTFLEPSWPSTGNSQHPNYDVALGEQLIHDVYQSLRNGPRWNQTLLIITYDEHGGCYDHVAPPWGAAAPDDSIGEFGFKFDRYGIRVPGVIVSPLITPGVVYRAPAGGPPIDHTSILKTVERRWGLPALTRRDAVAPDLGGVLTLTAPRTDDALAGVSVPVSRSQTPSTTRPSRLQQIHAELVSRLPTPDDHGPSQPGLQTLPTNSDYADFIRNRTAAWKESRVARQRSSVVTEGP